MRLKLDKNVKFILNTLGRFHTGFFVSVGNISAYNVEPMIFRFHRKPKRNLGFEAKLSVRT